MSFLFRFERVERIDQETVLTGQMLRGEVHWSQRVDIQAEEGARTVFSAPLRGVGLVGLDDQQATMQVDFACWDKNFEFPKATVGEQRFRLVLHGAPPSDLPAQGIAWGVDEKTVPPELAAAIQASGPDAVVNRLPDTGPPPRAHGVPLREYPYQVDRRKIIVFAPWFMFLTVTILLIGGAVAWWGTRVDLSKWGALALFGMVDVFLLFLSVNMLFAARSKIVVTSAGIVLPIFAPDFSSRDVFLPFADMHGMLEYWHKDSVRLIKLDTRRGAYLINVFLMDRLHFEELRRLLWQRVHDDRAIASAAGDRQTAR